MASGSQNLTSYQANKWTNLRAFTIGGTSKDVDGTAAVSWSATEILGSSDSTKFYRGDKTWSDTLTAGLNAAYIGITNTDSTTGYGLSLYNGAFAGAPPYGIFFGGTATFGTHGSVTSDWATYFTMNNDTSRGWIFRCGNTNVASISGGGAVQLNGALTLSGDIILKTSSADSPDITWRYGDTDTEQARIWMGSGGTSKWAPYYRCYDSSGTQLYSGNLVLGDGTGASGTWSISISGNAATATRINGNLAAATSDVARNIWVSSTAGADGIPNYISGFNMNPSTKNFTVPAGTRITASNGALYLGNSGNANWVYIQDMCSQDGQKWKIHQGGNAEFTGTITASTFSGNATSASHATTFGSAAACRVYFHNSDECNFAGSNTSTNLYFNYRAVGEGRPIPSNFIFGGSAGTATIKAAKVLNAVWNDFAEFRIVDINEPGRVVIPTRTGIATKSSERLQSGGRIISDTYGCAVGESDTAKTPLGMAGRVLAYPYRNKNEYNIGDCVCTAPNGTVDIMTREEIMMYPECIIGIVNEIPNYEFWEQTLTALDPKKQGGGRPTYYTKSRSQGPYLDRYQVIPSSYRAALQLKEAV